jgi:hypothetical protein
MGPQGVGPRGGWSDADPVHARVATLADVEALYHGLDVLPKVA